MTGGVTIKKGLRIIRTTVLLVFIVFVFGYLVYSRIRAYSLAPTMKPAHFYGMEWWRIPIVYLVDYFSHAWSCLLFAFTAAGLVYEFIPKQAVMKYMSSGRVLGYVMALGVAPFFTVCSCTMVPLFAGILYTGSGIGPAMTFLLMAPAANIMTILLTGEIISWELAMVRIAVSVITALAAGLIIMKTPWGRRIEEALKVTSAASPSVEIQNPPFDEGLWSAIKFAGHLGKMIFPAYIVGLVACSYLEAYTPEAVVVQYLTGFTGVLMASVIGGPLYTPTLVEIVLGRTLIDLGMSRAAALSWLMGQPYDIPNMVAVSRIVRWKVVSTYAIIAWFFSVMFGLTYGLLVGGLTVGF